MFKIYENVIFQNVDECENYFENFIEQYCENDVVMQRNVYEFFKNVKNKCKNKFSKNITFAKYDDCFYIIVKNRHDIEIQNYYINDDFEFLYNKTTMCNSICSFLYELFY